jgi:hypothetical protein
LHNLKQQIAEAFGRSELRRTRSGTPYGIPHVHATPDEIYRAINQFVYTDGKPVILHEQVQSLMTYPVE